MAKPLLSVCLISYNQKSYIQQAVDTILMQKVDFDWQLVIADDCSTDGTREILLKYQQQHPKLIKLILQKQNVGPETNWLDLMAYPSSKYVLYAEGDDYFNDPAKLRRQVDFLETHDDFSICFHPVKVIYEDGSRPDEIFPTPKQRYGKDVLELKDLLLNNFIQTNSAMYRWRFNGENIKDVFPKNIAPGDWFLHILHADKGKIGFINKTMSVYRKHPGGLWWDSSSNQEVFWRKYGLAWLRLYMELLKMYGAKAEYRQIIEGSTINMLNSFVKVDEKQQGHDLFNSAISAFPEAADIYIDNLRQQVTNLHHHADEQAKVIQHYVDLSQSLQQVERENDQLKAKLLIRLEGALRKRVKRNKA